MAFLLGATGVASVQAVADILSLALAIPVLRRVMKKIPSTEDIQNLPKEAVPIPEGQL